jgi:mRNA interferase RelE/StbE
MKEIRYTKSAIRKLLRMPRNEAMRIRDKIDAYASDPNSQTANIKTLKGRDGVRLRVADWRVIMNDQGDVLDILEIGARGDVYK